MKFKTTLLKALQVCNTAFVDGVEVNFYMRNEVHMGKPVITIALKNMKTYRFPMDSEFELDEQAEAKTQSVDGTVMAISFKKNFLIPVVESDFE